MQPTFLAKTAFVDHSASSAITHQSYTNLVRKVPVVHTYAAPATVVKTVVPVVHAAPMSFVKTVATPIVHSAPVVHSYAAAPIIHSLPVVHAAAPVVKSGWF